MRSKSIISRALRFTLAFTMAMAICIGSFSVTNYKLKANAANNVVATLTIHADSKKNGYGHAFLSIKNKTNSNIYVLGVPVTPNGAITIGTYGDQKAKYGRGIFTNLDAYLIKYKGEYKNRACLSMNLTYAQLNTIQKTMRTNNIHTNYEKNCAWFAEKAWNSVASSKNQLSGSTLGIYTPAELAHSIMSKNGAKKNTQVGTCDKTDIRRIWTQGYLKVDKKDIVP